MNKIQSPFQQPEQKLDTNARIQIPAMMHPAFRSAVAIERNLHRTLMIKTWGGLGDQICAEPTLRHALTHFKDCTISLASHIPEVFSHLKFEKVFDSREVTPNWENYFVFETITPPNDSNMVWLFFNHMLTNCVDFPSMCAFRKQLPNAEKEIVLCPTETENTKQLEGYPIFIHPGKHWPSKTFPPSFWNAVIRELVDSYYTPVIIGADSDDNKSTVDVNTDGCIDMRNKLSLNETIYLLQRSKVLLTNDSSPLHMAASRNPNDPATGKNWIGYIATCKHPDLITHWRSGQFAYREVNFGKGGMWDIVDDLPNKSEDVLVDKVDQKLLESWLPDPVEYAKWAIQKALAND